MSKEKRYGTPEHYLKPFNIEDHGKVDIDAVQCALARASAISKMLGANFDGTRDRFNDAIVTNALWALEGCIIQAQALLGDLDDCGGE